MVFDQRFKSVQSGSLVNEPNTTQDPGNKNLIVVLVPL